MSTDRIPDPSSGTRDWRMFQGGPARTGHQATSGTTDSISERWRFQTDDTVGSSPAVVNGTVYVGSGNNVYALSAD